MRLLLFFLLICRSLIAEEFPTQEGGKSIAVLISRENWRGEAAFAYRIQSACQNLQWKADILFIEKSKALWKKRYDFVINLVPGSYKRPFCNNFLTIFHPHHHYFEEGGLLHNTHRCYDGYLLTYSPTEADKNFGSKSQIPYLLWYPSAPYQKYRKVDPKHLFCFGFLWGNRVTDKKFSDLMFLLDREPFTRIYGATTFKPLYPHSYQGTIPYENDELFETEARAGVVLVIHSSDHNERGLPSGRIFEAAASSCVIICDQNPFVKEHFGDSVLYIDTDESAESILYQIQKLMRWIEENPEQALRMARRSYEINQKKFLLEDQLLRLEKFDQIIRERKKK